MEINEILKAVSENATNDVRDMLVPLDQIHKNEARVIIGRYTAAVLPNFVPWVTAALVSARSPRARDAAHENLEEEIRGNHQDMLYDFANSADALPTLHDEKIVTPVVSQIRSTVSKMNGLYNVSLCAFLENTSAAFIPYLESLAKMRGSGSLVYTQAHGEADIEHAKQFLRAVQQEREQGYSGADSIIGGAITDGNNLLRTIFTPGDGGFFG